MTHNQKALDRALAAWAGLVKEPKQTDKSQEADSYRTRIWTYIAIGLQWTWLKSYAGDGAFAWCGSFAAHAWNSVKPAIRKKSFASTFRFSQWGKENPRRRLATPIPGCISVVGPGPFGAHIVMPVLIGAAEIVTVEGNGIGGFPDGSAGEGVVMRVRPVADFRFHYQPLPEDLDN